MVKVQEIVNKAQQQLKDTDQIISNEDKHAIRYCSTSPKQKELEKSIELNNISINVDTDEEDECTFFSLSNWYNIKDDNA